MTETDDEAFARLERIYARHTGNLGPMSRAGWLAYWRTMEATEPDPMPLCPVCGNDAPRRAWCSTACEEVDRGV